MLECHSLSLVELITLSLSKLSLLQRMTSNDNNGKRKMEEEAESSMVRKRLWLFNDDGGDADSSDSLEEESPEEEMPEEEEVSSKEASMNQLDTSKKLYARHTHGILFSDDGDTHQRRQNHAHQKVADAPMRRAVTTTMTSGCR
jgi:hypothetical protein